MNQLKIDYKMHFAFNGVGTRIGEQIFVDFKEDWGALTSEVARLQRIEELCMELQVIDMGDSIDVLNPEVMEEIIDLVWSDK